MRKAALMRLLGLVGSAVAVLFGGDTVWPK
jgi:hypothetical protein